MAGAMPFKLFDFWYDSEMAKDECGSSSVKVDDLKNEMTWLQE